MPSVGGGTAALGGCYLVLCCRATCRTGRPPSKRGLHKSKGTSCFSKTACVVFSFLFCWLFVSLLSYCRSSRSLACLSCLIKDCRPADRLRKEMAPTRHTPIIPPHPSPLSLLDTPWQIQNESAATAGRDAKAIWCYKGSSHDDRSISNEKG